jgi:hypothetical protein
MPCAANSFEICGGPLALEVYQFQNVAPILSALAALNGPTNALAALVNSVTSSNVQTIGPVSHSFCHVFDAFLFVSKLSTHLFFSSKLHQASKV